MSNYTTLHAIITKCLLCKGSLLTPYRKVYDCKDMDCPLYPFRRGDKAEAMLSNRLPLLEKFMEFTDEHIKK